MFCYQCPNTTNRYGTIRSVKNDVVAIINASHCEQFRVCWLVRWNWRWEKRQRVREVGFCLESIRLLSQYLHLKREEDVYVVVVVMGLFPLLVTTHSSLKWGEGGRRVRERSREIKNEQLGWYIERLYIISCWLIHSIMHSYSMWFEKSGGAIHYICIMCNKHFINLTNFFTCLKTCSNRPSLFPQVGCYTVIAFILWLLLTAVN